jgi:hypothetical protein
VNSSGTLVNCNRSPVGRSENKGFWQGDPIATGKEVNQLTHQIQTPTKRLCGRRNPMPNLWVSGFGLFSHETHFATVIQFRD